MGSCANVLCKVILLKDAWTTLSRNPLPLLLGALAVLFGALGRNGGAAQEIAQLWPLKRPTLLRTLALSLMSVRSYGLRVLQGTPCNTPPLH
ncbi:MAG: hypothetical protein EBX90_01260 [Betaproteobacteria bacterium]|nr:hypothetical protein [Betaproteobacteria bacterium]